MRWLVALLLALVVLGAPACGAGDDDRDGAAPSGQGQTLRTGGVDAFEAELERLAGKPVVVNKWASWCTPCKEEFPFFVEAAKELEGQIAFLGVDSRDSTDDAEAFLAKFPTPYPHFEDGEGDVGQAMGAGRSWPSTVFYSADGKRNYVRQGAYRSKDDLLEDVRRYAVGG
jgi:thiol-disulfide isomerase/thioredoxin